MIKTVVWSARAKADLKAIKTFFDTRNGNSNYSKKLLNIFKAASSLILAQPAMGKRTDIPNVKGLVILDYILFYEELDKHILILSVWDCRENPNDLNLIVE